MQIDLGVLVMWAVKKWPHYFGSPCTAIYDFYRQTRMHVNTNFSQHSGNQTVIVSCQQGNWWWR